MSLKTENKGDGDGYVVTRQAGEGKRQYEGQTWTGEDGKTETRSISPYRHPRDTKRGYVGRNREGRGRQERRITVTLHLGGRTKQLVEFKEVRTLGILLDAMESIRGLGSQANGHVEYVLDMAIRVGGTDERWVELKGTCRKGNGPTSTVRSGVGSKLAKEGYRVRGEHGVAFAIEWFEDIVSKTIIW